MTVGSEESKRPNNIGFLTVLGNGEEGLIGGFLVLNPVGRPAEFHCTAPVRPNRAQEILYGATLRGFVCGEQIAPALVGRTKLELAAILTNSPDVLTGQNLVSAPMALVFEHAASVKTRPEDQTEVGQQYAAWAPETDRVKNEQLPPADDAKPVFYRSLSDMPFVPGVDVSEWRETTIGRNILALPLSFDSETTGELDFDACRARIEPFFRSIDSVEPFERIRLAVEEAQRAN